MNTILYSRSGGPSMRMVLERLRDADVGVDLRRRLRGVWTLGPPPEPIHKLIRWGSVARSGGAAMTYNRSSAIHLAASKPTARMHMQDVGVPVPLTSVVQHGQFNGPGPLPWVLRPAQHQGGRGFYLVNSREELSDVPYEDGWYVSQFYPKTREYRVHIGSGYILKVTEKRPRKGHEKDRELPVWNHATNDFEFVPVRWDNWQRDVVEPAINAVRELGLDFGAADMLAYAGEGYPPAVVCEVNTAPSVDTPHSSAKYAAYFAWLLRTDTHREWVHIDAERASSYAFREEL